MKVSDTVLVTLISACSTVIVTLLTLLLKRLETVHTLVNSRAKQQDEAIAALTIANTELQTTNATLRESATVFAEAIRRPPSPSRPTKASKKRK